MPAQDQPQNKVQINTNKAGKSQNKVLIISQEEFSMQKKIKSLSFCSVN